MQCPQCQHDNQPGAKFCVECASPVERRRCPACGTEAAPTAKFCPECAAPLTAKSAPAGLTPGQSSAPTDAGERRHLTALFCDLVGSTDIASRIDPEEWHRISKAYQEAAAAAVTRFGGHVDKFLGDGLVCFFGVPQAHEDDAERAVRAGLAIVDAVHGLNGNATGQAPELRVRVGLHTGSAVVAHGGGASKDVFGDTPNIAARVQGVAEPDTVVISAATQRLVAGLFVVEERGAQQLKGVPQPVVLYRVVQPSGMRSRLDVSAGRHTPFVGRQSELSVLADAWERVVEGIGQTVLVQGEAGIGKSRLCYQLREQLGDQPHTWLECRCSPYTTGTPFRPVIELVDQALTFQLTDTPADKLGKLQIGLERGGVAGDETVALLAEWLELPESAGYTTRSINPDVKRRKTLELLAAWNFKLAELQPMVVMVEDLHWCDPSSLELLGRLVAQSATAHVLLVGTARPEFASPWPARSNLQTVSLGRLTEPQTREMIAALSAARALPETVVEQLVARADGIPLFAEELTQAVVEAGGDAAVAEIPVTLQDSLLARLDRISSAKEVAQRAAVLGREFSYALLAATAGLDEEALQHRLARLVEAELIFVRGEPPEATYTFKHALVQEAAYESLLKRARLSLHGTVVDALLRDFPERVAAEPEVLAQHAELAGRIGEAIAFYQRAGEREKQRFAHEEAITDLRRALDLLARQPEGTEHDAREVAIQLALAGSLVVAKGLSHPEPQIAYDRARILCEKQLDERLLCLASIGLSILSFARGEVEQGRSLAARVITTAEQMGDQELALLGHIQVAIPENFQGKLVSSLAHLRVARSLYQPDRHHAVVSILFTDPGVSTLAFMGAVLEGLGWRDQGLARAREGVELARRLGHPSSLAQALFFETTIHWARRDPDAQRERAAETIALAEAQGLPYFLGLGRTFHAGARVAAGELGAIADVLAGVEFAAGAGNLGGAPASFVLLGEAHLAAGQPADALGVVDMGLALSAQTGQAFFDAELHRLRGEIWLRRSDDAPEQIESEKRAEACFHDALDVAIAQELKPFELRASTSLARLWWDQGKRTEARDLLAPVYGWFTEGFDTRDLIDAKAILEEL